MECLASLALGAILFLTGALLIYEGIKKIVSGTSISTPGQIALIAAIVSIVVKEGMYWYTKINANRINSDALKAEAWHHRSDALSSIGSLIGVAGAMLGLKILDPVMGCVIGVVIIKVSYDIAKESVDKMVDKACDDDTVDALKKEVEKVPGVKELDIIKTRMFGTKIYVEIEISVDGNMILKDADVLSIPYQTNAGEVPRISINQATRDELQQLDGIGPSTADAIIQYREEHGLYQTIEDIMKVKGIGNAKFEKIKEKITL